MSKAMTVTDRVEETFAAPAFREKQKRATEEVVKGIDDPSIDVVLLNAPTGAGKSLILDGAARATEGRSFITTPLNTLVDQIDNDEFISDHVITLKGRNNYDCIHPEDKGTPVDKAICQRKSSFECELKAECPYYGRKMAALGHDEVVTNMSYLMAEGMIPDEVENTFGSRSKLFVDECQNIESFAMSFIQSTISKRTVPDNVWKNISIPRDKYEDDMDYLVDWLESEVLVAVDRVLTELRNISVLSEDQSSTFENLRQFRTRVKNLLDDVEYNEWVAETDTIINKNKSNTRKITFKPVYIGRFLRDLLWDRGDTIVLSSATIPGGNWLEEIGLGDKTKKVVSVGSTFPIENRRVIANLDVGKMVSTYSDDENNRETNAWDMAKRIMEIAMHHEGEKGMIHCRSYNIMKLLRRQCMNHDTVTIDGDTYSPSRWFRNNVMLQDRYNRDESLQDWIDSDMQVFFSVAMDEGVDLDGEKCRWQALAKTLYPFMTKRMKRRKEIAYHKGDSQEFWDYYNRRAAIQIQQSYGRAVRSKDDYAVFYVLDSSAVQQQGLIQMNAELFNEWFLEAIEGINIDPSRGI